MLKPGHKLELEITTGSSQYSIPRTGPYQVTFDNARVKHPLTPCGPPPPSRPLTKPRTTRTV